jgi:hypothetical protein
MPRARTAPPRVRTVYRTRPVYHVRTVERVRTRYVYVVPQPVYSSCGGCAPAAVVQYVQPVVQYVAPAPQYYLPATTCGGCGYGGYAVTARPYYWAQRWRYGYRGNYGYRGFYGYRGYHRYAVRY